MVQMLNTSPSDVPPPVYVLGVRVDRLTQRQVLASLEQILSSAQRSSTPLPCQQIVTVNPEFVMAAQRDSLFCACINQAALVMADGIGIVLAARYLRQPTPERVTGIDTLSELATLCARQGYRMFLLGAAPGVAEIAGERLQEMAPGLQIAGTYAGSPALDEEQAILERVRTARADVLCVAYGAPAQDLWIYRNLSRLPVALAMGVGGSFDFLAGRQRRAPYWMRKSGLEWLYRLYREPWRWRRMLALPQFALSVVLKGRNSHDA
ncbi:WecB/TagA/CpsF family glycosyltransferase [Dictyobacter kobayashii]|uniref:WecB/TagA/CpsF family glycosyl transferase n=1 Tax=Dictyobacter kobayashii TaxID=2014872 RepID=A0A402AFY7_9CHLR|nr:WecB/TagA/CpsF family glycosyltransferase [Dictyobacter kobayashii]GCE17973.1 WecB/TagA/CpsF family glycosyl transferase [Dictyobacter kobayashii]